MEQYEAPPARRCAKLVVEMIAEKNAPLNLSASERAWRRERHCDDPSGRSWCALQVRIGQALRTKGGGHT